MSSSLRWNFIALYLQVNFHLELQKKLFLEQSAGFSLGLITVELSASSAVGSIFQPQSKFLAIL